MHIFQLWIFIRTESYSSSLPFAYKTLTCTIFTSSSIKLCTTQSSLLHQSSSVLHHPHIFINQALHYTIFTSSSIKLFTLHHLHLHQSKFHSAILHHNKNTQ
ncbi:unnamed protein product [Lathyrus sativus]|nr:unnamed protein product [Lathyrus sativus]